MPKRRRIYRLFTFAIEYIGGSIAASLIGRDLSRLSNL